MSNMPKEKIIWQPQPGPQKALIDCPVYEIFYGGARGGGKTDGVLGKMGLKAEKYGSAFNCIFFRKEIPMLDDAISRSKDLFLPLGAKWVDHKKTWLFKGGGRLRFRPLEKDNDAEKYQGQNLSDVCIEEVGNYADPSPIKKMHAVLRSTRGIPTQMHLTGNPGGAGQGWLKDRFIDPCPSGFKILKSKFAGSFIRSRVFIPAKVSDNKILTKNDPNYIGNLYMTGSNALVKAWLDGDWDAVEGAYFDSFDKSKHVIKPFKIPEHWYRIRAFDWGYAAPFCTLWFAVSDGTPVECDGGFVSFPKGALIVYREWYGAKEPNVGLRMENNKIAEGIIERELYEKIHDMVADPAIWISLGGVSIGEQMMHEGCFFRRADNKRISGWQQVRQRLKGDDGVPMLYFFSTCTALIRTLPSLQHDKTNPEDLDTEAEDHAADTLRYGCMSRPLVKKKVDKPKEWDANIYVEDVVREIRKNSKKKGFK
jgi:hypothetical protein